MAKLAPPGERFRRLVTETTPYELLVALLTLSVGVFNATEKQFAIATVQIVAAVLIFVVTAVKLYVAWSNKEAAHSPHRLQSSLYALHAVLIAGEEGEKDPKLRITIHVPTKNGKELEQALDYVGDGRGGHTAKRRFSVNTGIIGAAFRQKDPLVAVRRSTNTEEYVRELIEDWGYTENDARNRDHSAMSWMAVPLVSGDGTRVEGVVYFDSVDPEFFTEVRQNLALYGCVGIAQCIDETYSS